MNQTQAHTTESPLNSGTGVGESEELSPEVAQLAEQKDRYLRLLADFDNFRKRTALESERRASAQKDTLIRELLPVIDNFERSLAVGPDTTSQQVAEGLGMILQQLRQILRQNNIETEDCVGRQFDPLRHEAIGSRCDPSKPDQAVLENVQRGYYRGREVVRPSKVIVNDRAK